jgi:hypothetical protein
MLPFASSTMIGAPLVMLPIFTGTDGAAVAVTVIVAAADLVSLATEVALRVTLSGVGTMAGAV